MLKNTILILALLTLACGEENKEEKCEGNVFRCNQNTVEGCDYGLWVVIQPCEYSCLKDDSYTYCRHACTTPNCDSCVSIFGDNGNSPSAFCGEELCDDICYP